MNRTQLLKNITNKRSNAKGLLGEYLAIQGIRRYASVKHTANIGHSGDIKVNTSKIEVKTALQNKNNTFKACLKKNDKYGYTDYTDSDYILLQLISNNGLFNLYLIPTNEIEQKHINISFNSSKFAKYQTTYKQIAQTI